MERTCTAGGPSGSPVEQSLAFQACVEVFDDLGDTVTKKTVAPMPVHRVLFLGPFAVQSVVEQVARETRDALTNQIPAVLQFVDVSPPYSVEVELEPREYWVRLAHKGV